MTAALSDLADRGMASVRGTRYDQILVGPDEVRARDVLLDMMDLLSRDPYEALGLIPSATAADIRNAFLTKTKQFHPARFGRMAIDIQKLANEVFLSLRAAHDAIARPSTVGKPAGARPLGPSPLKPSGTGQTAALRPPGAPPVGVATPRTLTPTGAPMRPSPMPGSTQPIRSGTTPNPVINNRPAGTAPAASMRPPTQPLRSVDGQPGHVPSQGTQPMRTDPRAPAQATRPGVAPARPPTGQTPVLPRPGAAPAAPAGAKPVERELVPILDLIAQQQLAAAKVALETLVARSPQSTKYRALLAYVKGREAQLDKRIDEARVELQDALQLDPDLQLAKTALAELFSRRR